MRHQTLLKAIFLSVLLIGLSLTVEVTPNSSCSSLCLNSALDDPADSKSSYTVAKDLICSDSVFVKQTLDGVKWRDCLSCEQKSNATDAKTGQSDLYWFLFNIKFAFDWCIFAYPNNDSPSPAAASCSDVCAGSNNSAKTALTDRLLEVNADLQYRYCEQPNILETFDDCIVCMNKVPDVQTLTQYIKALKAACMQKPDVGQTIKLDFDLFPTATSRVSSTSQVSSTSRAFSTSRISSTKTITEIDTYIGSATLTFTSPDPAVSSLITSLQTVFSTTAASESAAAASKVSSDRKARTNVGVGVGFSVGGFLAISIVVWVIVMRHRSERRKKAEKGEARNRSELEAHIRLELE